MNRNRWFQICMGFLIWCLLIATSGCAQLPSGSERADVLRHLPPFPGRDATVEQTFSVEAERKNILAGPMDEAKVIRLALINSPTIQKAYEEAGIARGESIRASAFPNPTLSVTAIPNPGNEPLDVELEGELDLASLFRVPGQRGAASARLREASLRSAADVFHHLQAVRAAYHTHVAAREIHQVVRAMHDAARASADYAERLYTAGNTSELEAAAYRDVASNVSIDLDQSKLDVDETGFGLRVLLGLTDEAPDLRVPDSLPGTLPPLPSSAWIDSTAARFRMDIQASVAAVEAAGRELGLVQTWRWLPGLEVGVSAEKSEGAWRSGPMVKAALPVFDRSPGALVESRSRLRWAEADLTETAARAAAEIRSAERRALLARTVSIRYTEEILPTRARMVALTQERYNFMLMGTFNLLSAKQAEIEAHRDRIVATRDYWIARADLERSIGATLPVLPPPVHRPAVPAAHPHHGHRH